MKASSVVWAALAMVAWICGLAGAGAAEFRSGHEIKLDGEYNDLVFLSGGKLGVTAKVTDDIFAAGGDLNFTGASADHVITAGGNINFDDVQVKTVIVTGGQIRFNHSQISGHIIAAGGQIDLGEGSNIGSSAVITGGQITLDGNVGGDLVVRGGELTINGQVSGNADIEAKEIRLGPHAVIAGNFKHRSHDLIISPGATIKGETTKLPYDDKFERAKVHFIVIGSVLGLLFLAGIGVCVLVLAGVFAGHMQATDRAIRGKILSTLGIGLLALIGIPALCIVFAATVVGLPLALFLISLWIAVQPLCFAGVAHATGMAIRGGLRRGDEAVPSAGGRVAYALLGLAIIVVLGLVPVIGHIVWLVASIIGLGATMRVLYVELARGSAEA